MKKSYQTFAISDIGTSKRVNQDSLIVKHKVILHKEVLMAIICDGVGGLSKGEIASSTVIDEFRKWFTKHLKNELRDVDMRVIGSKWELLAKSINSEIREYSEKINIKMGTTLTGVLFIDDEYIVVHVGDSRLYYIGNELTQLTEDHTIVAREVKKGILTPEQAEKDKRKHIIFQCIGANHEVAPQIITGKSESGVYLLCSDGFRNRLSEQEMISAFQNSNIKEIKQNCKAIIETVKERGERDNISVIAIRRNQAELAIS